LTLTTGLAFMGTVPYFWTSLSQTSPSFAIRHPKIHLGGDSKAWLRRHADFTTPIFSTGDNQLYYISSLPISPIRDDFKIAQEIGLHPSAETLIEKLHSLGFRYAIDTAHWQQRYWTFHSMLLDTATSFHPEALAYEGQNSKVIDLHVLLASMKEACIRPSRTAEFLDGLTRIPL